MLTLLIVFLNLSTCCLKFLFVSVCSFCCLLFCSYVFFLFCSLVCPFPKLLLLSAFLNSFSLALKLCLLIFLANDTEKAVLDESEKYVVMVGCFKDLVVLAVVSAVVVVVVVAGGGVVVTDGVSVVLVVALSSWRVSIEVCFFLDIEEVCAKCDLSSTVDGFLKISLIKKDFLIGIILTF